MEKRKSGASGGWGGEKWAREKSKVHLYCVLISAVFHCRNVNIITAKADQFFVQSTRKEEKKLKIKPCVGVAAAEKLETNSAAPCEI